MLSSFNFKKIQGFSLKIISFWKINLEFFWMKIFKQIFLMKTLKIDGINQQMIKTETYFKVINKQKHWA